MSVGAVTATVKQPLERELAVPPPASIATAANVLTAKSNQLKPPQQLPPLTPASAKNVEAVRLMAASKEERADSAIDDANTVDRAFENSCPPPPSALDGIGTHRYIRAVLLLGLFIIAITGAISQAIAGYELYVWISLLDCILLLALAQRSAPVHSIALAITMSVTGVYVFAAVNQSFVRFGIEKYYSQQVAGPYLLFLSVPAMFLVTFDDTWHKFVRAVRMISLRLAFLLISNLVASILWWSIGRDGGGVLFGTHVFMSGLLFAASPAGGLGLGGQYSYWISIVWFSLIEYWSVAWMSAARQQIEHPQPVPLLIAAALITSLTQFMFLWRSISVLRSDRERKQLDAAAPVPPADWVSAVDLSQNSALGMTSCIGIALIGLSVLGGHSAKNNSADTWAGAHVVLSIALLLLSLTDVTKRKAATPATGSDEFHVHVRLPVLSSKPRDLLSLPHDKWKTIELAFKSRTGSSNESAELIGAAGISSIAGRTASGIAGSIWLMCSCADLTRGLERAMRIRSNTKNYVQLSEEVLGYSSDAALIAGNAILLASAIIGAAIYVLGIISNVKFRPKNTFAAPMRWIVAHTIKLLISLAAVIVLIAYLLIWAPNQNAGANSSLRIDELTLAPATRRHDFLGQRWYWHDHVIDVLTYTVWSMVFSTAALVSSMRCGVPARGSIAGVLCVVTAFFSTYLCLNAWGRALFLLPFTTATAVTANLYAPTHAVAIIGFAIAGFGELLTVIISVYAGGWVPLPFTVSLTGKPPPPPPPPPPPQLPPAPVRGLFGAAQPPNNPNNRTAMPIPAAGFQSSPVEIAPSFWQPIPPVATVLAPAAAPAPTPTPTAATAVGVALFDPRSTAPQNPTPTQPLVFVPFATPRPAAAAATALAAPTAAPAATAETAAIPPIDKSKAEESVPTPLHVLPPVSPPPMPIAATAAAAAAAAEVLAPIQTPNAGVQPEPKAPFAGLGARKPDAAAGVDREPVEREEFIQLLTEVRDLRKTVRLMEATISLLSAAVALHAPQSQSQSQSQPAAAAATAAAAAVATEPIAPTVSASASITVPETDAKQP